VADVVLEAAGAAKHPAMFEAGCRVSLHPVASAFEDASPSIAVEVPTPWQLTVVPTVSNVCNGHKITFFQSLTA
jgi:hypothetical protein